MKRNDIPQDVKDALVALLEFLWADELDDFYANPAKDHIFPRLVALHNWFYGRTGTAEEYVRQEFEDDQWLLESTPSHQGGNDHDQNRQ